MRHDEDDRADDAPSTVTVGRENERAMLERAWLDASERSSYVVIRGEPGIGKSHLVRHTRRLVPEGGRSVVLRCSALHTNTPLYPVVQLLRSPATVLDDGDGDDPLARFARVAERHRGDERGEPLPPGADLRRPWPRSHGARPAAGAAARAHAGAPVLLDRRPGRQGPLLLVVEDLHWADPSTLDLLSRCVTEPPEHPLLIVVTTRLPADSAPGEPDAVISLQPLEPANAAT